MEWKWGSRDLRFLVWFTYKIIRRIIDEREIKKVGIEQDGFSNERKGLVAGGG